LDDAGVWMAYGQGFQSPEPGRFRIIFAVYEETLIEGMKRYTTSATT
jgi:aspartate/methionine/tyrosine aminotransferase